MRRACGVLLLGVALTAAACSEDGAAHGADSSATASRAPKAAAAAADAGASSTESVPDIGTKVVRTADLSVEVDEGTFADRLRRASALARTLGGFVQSSSTASYEKGDASGDVTLRVPVEHFDDAMTQLAKLGTVESSSEQGEDVTDQLVDLDARLRALRAEEDAMNALLADAKDVNDVLAIRSSSVGLRQQIEQLAAQQKSLQDRSSYSTIHVTLHESSTVLARSTPSSDHWDLARAMRTSLHAAEAIVGSLIVAVGLVLPLLPFVAVAWFVVRRRRRTVTAG